MSLIEIKELLKLIWANGLFESETLRTANGNTVTVHQYGDTNTGEGPDILNTVVEMDGVRHTGSIVLLERTSDWRKNLNHLSEGYDTCMLCVVLEDDTVICRTNGEVIPTATMTYPKALDELYTFLTSGPKGKEGSAKCGRVLAEMDHTKRCQHFTRLTIERLERKSKEFMSIYRESGNNWNEVFYIMLFRYMGAGTNREAYTKLARKVTYSNVCRIKQSVVSVEGLLLGAAGLLNTEEAGRYPDDYTVKLQKEADYLCKRFGIVPMQTREWSFEGHPNNGPVVRIVELAALLMSQDFLFSRLMECQDLKSVQKILSAEASEYWNLHFVPSKLSSFGVKRIGETIQKVLTINLVVPMMFTFGKVNENQEFTEKALDLLEEIGTERNFRTVGWMDAGVPADNAFFSQALIQLSQEYCEKKRCACCIIGKLLLCSQEKLVYLQDKTQCAI